jgi:hypothetical protein
VAKDEEVMEMFGDYLRELSVLILVFFPLELSKGQFDYALTVRVAKVSAWLLFAGIIFGKWKRIVSFLKRCFKALYVEFFGGKPSESE